MNKLKILKDKIKAMQEQYDKALIWQQQKVGALVLSLYERDVIKDDELKDAIAKIVGEDLKVASKADNNISKVAE